MLRASRVGLVCAVLLLPVAGLVSEATGEQAAESDAAAPAPVGAIPVTTRPSVLSRPQLMHPGEPREARVYVRFMVSEEGIPVEIEVEDERGFHTEPFRKVALKYVSELRFKPATREGVPVVFGPMTQPINFGFGLTREELGVTPEFRRELDKVGKFLKDGDFAGAHFHAEWMLREKVTLGYEFAVLQAQLAQTLASVGRLDEALTAAQAATGRTASEAAGFKIGEPPPRNDASRYLLPKDLIVYLLGLRMQLLAQKGEVLGALKTYNEIAGLETLKPGDPRTLLSEKLIALLQNGDALLFKGEIRANREFWSHELYHPRFSTRNVQGRLGIVHLHCNGQYAEYEYEAERLWTVPSDWESCVVEFYGEPGTKVELVELPAA